MPTEQQIETAARSDAAFDGREFDGLRRLDRERYRERSRRALEAVEALADGPAAVKTAHEG